MKRLRLTLAMTGLAILVFASSLAFGQAVSGSILGTVTDPQGAAVAGAKVTITNQGKGTSDTTTSNADGNYSVTHLIPDVYSLRVEAPGFKVIEQKGIIVSADAGSRVDAQFQIGSTSEQVEVTAEAPQLKTDRADVAMQFNEKYVENVPMLNNNFTTLQLLSPGSQKLVGWSHASTENPQAGQQIFSQGQHFSGTGFELDGTDNQDPILGIIVINPNLDAVTEAKVSLQNYDAEFGKAVASLVTAQTKSGSNQIHGSGFYFRRSDGLEARNPFTQATRNPLTNRFIPANKWQQFGGSLGGAVIKDKLFFFGDYQGTRQTNGNSTQITVPTATVQASCNPATNAASSTPGFCNLSEYLGQVNGGGQAYDPATGNQNTGAERTIFAGNLIPISRISPQAAAILAAFPAPQNSSLFNNFVGQGSGPFNQNAFDTRVDYTASSTLNVFGRFSLSYYNLSGKGLLGALGGPGTGLGGLSGSSVIHNYSLATGFTKTINSTLLTDFRFGWFKYNPQASKPDGGAPMTAFGIPNANTSDPKTAGLGAFLMDGGARTWSDFGDGLGVGRCNCPLTEREQQIQFVSNTTKMHGNHQFKFGADIRYATNLRLPSDNNRTGEYNFNHKGTSLEGAGGLDAATFLLGEVTQLQRYANNPAGSASPSEAQKRWFFYGQDTWRATSKLTINYGLRWEIYFPETVNGKGNGGFANITDYNGAGGIRVAGYGGIGTNGNINNNYHAFAPRLGIAYQLDPKTVIRMGYGRSYDIGVFGSNFGHTVTQNLPVLLKQNLKASNVSTGASDDIIPIFTLAQGPIAPDFGTIPSNGIIPLNSSLSGTHIRPTKQVLPTVDAWNLTVQRQLTNTITAEVSYVGSKGTHGFAGNGPNYDVNPVSMYGYGTALSQNQRRPLYPAIPFDLGNYYGNDAGSNYNAFQAQVTKRFTNGLQFLTHYTYSHANNYNDAYYAISHAIAWGPVDFNRNSVWVLNTVYELPFGKGKTYLGGVSKGMNYLVGGWQLSDTTNWSSGLPWTPSFNACNSEQDVGICRPSVGSHSLHTSVGTFDKVNLTRTYFVPVPDITKYPGGAFSDPGVGKLGNVGRNSYHGPAGFYSDMSMVKNFPIKDRYNAQFRFDAFNVFNHGVYGFSAQDYAATGGTCIDGCGGNNGKITNIEGQGGNSFSMRQLQFAVKFTF